MTCRFPELHAYSIDYKEKGKQQLVKENPIVVAEKIHQI